MATMRLLLQRYLVLVLFIAAYLTARTAGGGTYETLAHAIAAALPLAYLVMDQLSLRGTSRATTAPMRRERWRGRLLSYVGGAQAMLTLSMGLGSLMDFGGWPEGYAYVLFLLFLASLVIIYSGTAMFDAELRAPSGE